MATDAKQPGEDVPAMGPPPPPPATPLRPDRPDSADLTMLHRKALAALEEALPPGEQPRLVIPGLASSAIIATSARVFVFKVGARAGLPFGARLKEFEYETVMRADLRRAGEVDVVVIHAPLKISTCSSYWADSRDDQWRARNAIAVTRGSDQAARSVDELSRLLAKFRKRSTARRVEREPDPRVLDENTPDVVGRISELEQRGGRAEADTACPSCGNELGEGWQFCPRCGAPAALRRHGGSPQRRRRRPERGA